MARLTRSEALDILQRAHIDPARDFHTLSSGEVDALLVEADARRYRKPRNAPGSRARMFHAMVSHAADRRDT